MFLQIPNTSQQARLFTINFRSTSSRCTHPASSRGRSLALPLCTQGGSDLDIKLALGLTQPFVENTEDDDGEGGEDECGVGRDVPGPEDDAGVLDLGVPVRLWGE